MKNLRFLPLALATLLGTLLGAAPANAQQGYSAPPAPPSARPAACVQCEPPAFGPRTLLNHTFILPSASDSAFVTSDFGFTQGAVFVAADNVPLGEGAAVDLRLAGAAERFDFGVRFHERIGLFGSASGMIYSGIDSASAILSGAQVSFGWKVGLVGMLARFPKSGTQLGLRAFARGGLDSMIEPIRVLAAVADNPEAGLGAIVNGDIGRLILSNQDKVGGGGSLNLAQAMGRHFSVQTSLEASGTVGTFSQFTGEKDVDIDITQVDVGAGVALTADIAPYFPLAAQLEYRMDVTAAYLVSYQGQELEAELPDPSHFIGGGLYYSGRRDLLLGATAGTFINTGDVARDAIYGQLTMRYFF